MRALDKAVAVHNHADMKNRVLIVLAAMLLSAADKPVAVQDDPFAPAVLFVGPSRRLTKLMVIPEIRYSVAAEKSRTTAVISDPVVWVTVVYRGNWRRYARARVLGGNEIAGVRVGQREVITCRQELFQPGCQLYEKIGVPVPLGFDASEFVFQLVGDTNDIVVTVKGADIAAVRNAAAGYQAK